MRFLIAFFITVLVTNTGWSLKNHPALLKENQLTAVVYGEKSGFRQYLITSGAIKNVTLTENLKVPLGSLWKLFSYIYILKNSIQTPPYQCTGRDEAEKFCCETGKSITLDKALIKSCGLFFKFERLKITPEDWQKFWIEEFGLQYSWLKDSHQIKAESEVPLTDLLYTLAKLNDFPTLQKKVKNNLTRVFINGTAKGAIRYIGSLLKTKTFTWDHPLQDKKYIGGVAGWMQNNDVFWLMGAGTSKKIFDEWSEEIANFGLIGINSSPGECVKVRFFDRYPIESVVHLPNKITASAGTMSGKYRINFINGVTLDFVATRELNLRTDSGNFKIEGLFNIDHYIARVIDREIKSKPEEAAKAFAIAIRTFLLENAKFDGNCYQIADSSKRQRVSINPPSAESMRISLWTDRLILKGKEPIHYHSTVSSPGVMSWSFARNMAEKGFYYDEILKVSYRNHQIEPMSYRRNYSCKQDLKTENWIVTQSKKWDRQLRKIAGYQKPKDIRVCQLEFGKAFSNLNNNHIYITNLNFEENRLSIAHEYLHIAFKHHPLSLNEDFIEKTARKLVFNFTEAYEHF